MNQEIINQSIEYKRKVAGAFQAITQEDIKSKIAGSNLVVTTKIDGEYNLLYFDGTNSTLINSGGNVTTKLPILEEITKVLKTKNIKSLKAAVELHTKGDRSRVFEVMKALSSDTNELTISAFDIVSIDDENYIQEYVTTLDKLKELFDEYVVESKTITKEELGDYFIQKVIEESQEGLIIRSSDFPITYKLKPQHTIDLGVIGYTGENSQVRELLLAVMDGNENFIQVGIVGNGLDESTKSSLYETLSKDHIDSTYIEVDKRRVAFHMVKPTVVVEVAVNELLTENSKGIITKPFISYDETNGYELKSIIPSVSLIHPIIKRLRYDKSVNSHDIRVSQITDIVYIDNSSASTKELPKSEIVFKEVYTKASKGKTNVKKFLIYKTNKEEIDTSYPAYVFHFTDFSPTRKDPLKKDIRISNSKEQIESLCKAYIEKDIKKGWNLVE